MQTTAASTNPKRRIADAEVDLLLGAQIAVAWAGEAGEERRLGWWKSDLVSEYGGEDLFKRLLPNTFDWAVVQAVREAARRHDAARRARVHDPDTVVSLYRLGFTTDERADERLMELKRSGIAPGLAFPSFGELTEVAWSRDAFERWVRGHGDAVYEPAPAGRALNGAPPAALEPTVRHLVAALEPLSDEYPLPHYRRPASGRAR